MCMSLSISFLRIYVYIDKYTIILLLWLFLFHSSTPGVPKKRRCSPQEPWTGEEPWLPSQGGRAHRMSSQPPSGSDAPYQITKEDEMTYGTCEFASFVVCCKLSVNAWLFFAYKPLTQYSFNTLTKKLEISKISFLSLSNIREINQPTSDNFQQTILKIHVSLE